MRQKSFLAFGAVVALLCLAQATYAISLASTDFNGRTLTMTTAVNDTATNLNWTLNGLSDPGDMVSKNAANGGLAIFNGTPLTQNNFTPALNTGNGNTFWTTNINLTVLAGMEVTLTDVVFDYIATSGGEVLNVNRRSDFTVTLLDPSSVPVDAVTIADALSGTGTVPQVPTLTFTFGAPILLNAPGTYTLQIKGGDFTGANETGNHTGIDNLSINGRVVALTSVPEPASLSLLGLSALGLVVRRRRAC